MWACLLLALPAWSQAKVTGTVTDAASGEALPFAPVHYESKQRGTVTRDNGTFEIDRLPGQTLVFSCLGYEAQAIRVTSATTRLNIQLHAADIQLKEAAVHGKRRKYSRKDNPAVELMRKVIAAKAENDLHRHPYFSYRKYQKLTFSVNNFTEKILQEGRFKNMPFLRQHVEVCPETGKLILPISVQESVCEHIYSRSPRQEKEIVTGEQNTGLNQFLSTGDILNAVIKDSYTDVDIYQDNIRLLRENFISPISSTDALGFYRYFLGDTLTLNNQRCVEVTFTPNNGNDVGFRGNLFIRLDSTWQVEKVMLELPKSTGVNFMENLLINQEFESLPTGERVLKRDKMTCEVSFLDIGSTKFQVQRTSHYAGYSLDMVAAERFAFAGNTCVQPNARLQDEDFWAANRGEALTKSEANMGNLIREMQEVKHFKAFLFVVKAFVENFVETVTTPGAPNKVDIGPVNTMFSHNFVDGFRLRLSGRTTANLNKRLFLRGYGAYGFKDRRWKGMGEVTYSFHDCSYLPHEYPMDNVVVSVQSDVVSPSDKFIATDKDNVFTALKWTTQDQMMYAQNVKVKYQKEWAGGWSLATQFQRERTEPCGKFFYQPLGSAPTLDRSAWQRYLNTADVGLTLRYQPCSGYINTKQRRTPVNHEAPVVQLSHATGLNGVLGGDYTYNLTEAMLYKRLWLPYAWGELEVTAKGGVQWNKVPFPLLIMPAANISYIVQRETFSMVDNMEFLNDRYASMMLRWDLRGKVFNRIPLLERLHLREFLGFNMLWGALTDRNNPFLHPDDASMLHFPGHFNREGQYEYSSYVMARGKPYMECAFGIHNIFKILHVQMARRLNYLDHVHARKWGFRMMLQFNF